MIHVYTNIKKIEEPPNRENSNKFQEKWRSLVKKKIKTIQIIFISVRPKVRQRQKCHKKGREKKVN